MLIIRVKGTVPYEKMEKMRSDIKRQISEGFIVHDDSIEITIVNDMCSECGSNDLEEIVTRDIEGRVFSRVIKCNECDHLSETIK